MSPKDKLSSPEPKCGNCKHMARVGKRAGKPTSWYELSYTGYKNDPDAPFEPIQGKGACREPSVIKYAEQEYPTKLFYVTDLMLCSLWERKED